MPDSIESISSKDEVYELGPVQLYVKGDIHPRTVISIIPSKAPAKDSADVV